MYRATASAGPGPLPLYPVIGVIAYVLTAWSDAAVSPYAAFRSLVVAVIGSIFLLAAGWAIFRRSRAAAGWFAGGVLVALSGEPLRLLQLGGQLQPWLGWVWIALIVVTAVLAIRIAGRAVRSPEGRARVTRGLNGFSVLLLLAAVVTASLEGSLGYATGDLAQGRGLAEARPRTGASAAQPDIYLLLLDGYPRADTLADVYGFDNSAFNDALEERGFEVAEGSRANYMFTQLTLLSMFHMRHVGEVTLDGPTRSIGEVNRAVRRAINESPALSILHERGYNVVASSPGYESVVLRHADVYLDSGHANEFERHLLRRTHLIDILGVVARDWLPAQHRERIEANFADLEAVVSAEDLGSRFALIHVAAPHTPLIFEADGSPVDVPDLRRFYGDTPQLMGVSRDEFIAGTVGQIEHLNSVTLDVVDRVLANAHDPPVIIVMSDHGTRMDVTYGDPKDPDLDERFRSLFAAYTPGREGLFGKGITPVNVLPILFNAYLGTELDCISDDSFANGAGNLLELYPYPNPDAGTNPDCGRGDSQ